MSASSLSILPPAPNHPPAGQGASRAGRRYLALWFPYFSVERAQAARRSSAPLSSDPRPCVAVDKIRGALTIIGRDGAGERAGLSLGMTLSEARAIVPDLATVAADRAADEAFGRAVAGLCEMFTPLVALRGREGVLLDVTGCTHLFGGEAAMMARVRLRLAARGLTSRAALAGTPDAAWAFAHHRPETVIPPGGEEDAARALPLAALGQEDATLRALGRAGFLTLGDLAERPAKMLAARFGGDLVTALHRVLGREDLRIVPLRAVPDLMTEKHFAEPLTRLEGLLQALERLAADIMRALAARGAGGRAFDVAFFRTDGVVRRLRIETALPCRDGESLMRLIGLRIGALADPLDPGFGFDAVRLGVLRSDPVQARQERLPHPKDLTHQENSTLLASAAEGAPGEEAPSWHNTPKDRTKGANRGFAWPEPLSGAAEGAREEGETEGEAEIAALVDRLVARFGRDQVQRFIARETHDPVRAGGAVPYLSDIPSASWPEGRPDDPPDRPLSLFDPPQPIEALAEVPDGPPLRFRWRRVLHDVARAEGPERIAPEWWRSTSSIPPTRDYYRIENGSGHRFWVFREGFYEGDGARARWFMHGVFA